MNEQMKNFYDQVGLDFENFQRVTVTKGDMEKFAELIVRECGKVYIQNQQDGVMTLTQDLLQHFGVKE